MSDWNGFKGAAKRIEDVDLPRIGEQIGVGEDEIHAFMDVEAQGSGFDSKGRPKMLFEPHVFYRNLTGADRGKAVGLGLAYEKWKPGAYPRDSYPRLLKAMEIHESAALKSASWGLGQILGENHRMVGYGTVQEMVRAFMADEETHLEAIVKFLNSAGLADDLRAHRWEAVARGYNGPAHAKHNYAGRMKRAFEKWRKIRDTPLPKARPLRVKRPGIAEQSEVLNVARVQKLLRELGYSEVGREDGKMGPRTEAGILAFRNDNGLPLTKAIDDDFLAALTRAPKRRESPERANATASDLSDSPGIKAGQLTKIIGGVAGVAGIGGGVVDSITEDTGRIGDTIQTSLDTADRVNGLINTVLDIGPWVILVIIGAATAYFGYRTVRHLVVRYRTGNHV